MEEVLVNAKVVLDFLTVEYSYMKSSSTRILYLDY